MRMTKWLAAVIAGMAVSAQAADLLIAWDSSTSTNGAYHVTGISGNIYTAKAADAGANTAQSTDGTYGSLFTGASVSANWAVSLGTNNAATTNNLLSIRIANNTGTNVSLDKIHFDISGNKAGAPRDFELRYAYGNLTGVTGGEVITNFSNPALAGLIGDYQDYDIPLTGLADCVLANGQSATFNLVASNATGNFWVKVDNIAFSGTVGSGPSNKLRLIVIGVLPPPGSF